LNFARGNTGILEVPFIEFHYHLSEGSKDIVKESKVRWMLGRAIAQAVSRWLPTAAAQVRSQVRSCGICGRQSGTGAGFLRVLRFPLQSSFHQLLHNHLNLSPGAGTIGQQWPTYQVDSVSPHPEKLKKKKVDVKIN
jgi:hypothetical protein